mmetsp:Transcript_117387/g.343784  ORF Transcript_117387/g.343784 Transcript_117387/m.343784 type:complete len:340 (-) Transcript_117387:415-1434(-)
MGVVKVSQLEDQPFSCGNCHPGLDGSTPPEVCTAYRGSVFGSAAGGPRQASSDCSTEYAAVSEDEDPLGTPTTAAPPEPESPQASTPACSPVESPVSQLEAVNCIIFDWDDTLLPTSFLGDVSRITLAGQYQHFGQTPPTERLPCHEMLEQHADLVRRILTGACAVAHVAIVTSSVRPWVDRSAEQHLPGLDTPRLLADLGIPVLYAPESWTPSMENMSMVEAYTACKRNVMLEFLNSVCIGGRTLKNAISVGDSPVERAAMKQVMQRWDHNPDAAERPRCKTIKFMGDPTVKQLSNELELLMAWMERVVDLEVDFDLVIDPWDNISSKFRSQLGPLGC